jgi:hypothetical protein
MSFEVAIDVAIMEAKQGYILVSDDTVIIAIGDIRWGTYVVFVIGPSQSIDFFLPIASEKSFPCLEQEKIELGKNTGKKPRKN